MIADNSSLPQNDPFIISRIECSVYRVPITKVVATSFGIMRDRPAVFVKLTDRDGAFGFGEIFANWPAAGAEHRARLLMEDIADLVLGVEFESPADFFHKLESQTHIRALQCGEWGPFRHVIAGLDIAAYDLCARRKGLPLRIYLNEAANETVPVYASGIHINRGAEMIGDCRQAGYTAFKVKIGFGHDNDITQLRSLCGSLSDGEQLFSDANQAWGVSEAIRFAERMEGLQIGWLEEPLAADAPFDDWQRLSEASSVPLAGGENMAGFAEFEAAIISQHFGVLQPDLAKWGGFTGCFQVARAIIQAKIRYCPHFLGGGIGLLASAHLLAAAGFGERGDGRLEVDANPNPLRELFDLSISEGMMDLRESAGLGVEALPEALMPYQTLSLAQNET